MVSFVHGIYYFNISVMRVIHIDVEVCSFKFFLLYHIPVCEYITIISPFIYPFTVVGQFGSLNFGTIMCSSAIKILMYHYVSAALYMYFSWLYMRKWNYWVIKYMYYILLDIANQITK